MPRRSTIFVSICGIITTAIFTKTTASTTSDIRKTVIVKDAVYVYMSPVRAFIFTKKQCGDDFGSLVGFIQEKVKQYKDYEPEETEENGGTDE